MEGDLQQMPKSFAVTELWQVLCGQEKGRDNDTQITFFDSVGFAMEDFSALRYVHEMSQALNLGEEIPLIPALHDPKDLYQLIQPTARVVQLRA
jgi:ornithine cyclodeaminase